MQWDHDYEVISTRLRALRKRHDFYLYECVITTEWATMS
jgi:hypothetical protein